jgi:hypothetical protein
MAQKEIIEEALLKSPNRRAMFKKLAFASAALTVAAQAQSSTPTPGDVVQFALNLEYLEAEFYSVATTGLTLAQQGGVALTGSGTAGATTTRYSNPVNFTTSAAFRVAINIAADELNHVIGLRAALTANGITPVAKPAINLDALLPMGASLGNQPAFLVLARIFEDIGVSAYSGAAPLLAGSPYLATAARILAVEGEHVGNIRLQSALLSVSNPQLDAADIVPRPPERITSPPIRQMAYALSVHRDRFCSWLMARQMFLRRFLPQRSERRHQHVQHSGSRKQLEPTDSWKSQKRFGSPMKLIHRGPWEFPQSPACLSLGTTEPKQSH